MCGITGCLNLSGKSRDATANCVHAMTARIAHRGPDDEGYCTWDGKSLLAFSGNETVQPHKTSLPNFKQANHSNSLLAMGHRRFSIIDTSPAAHQPFMDPDKRVSLVFNGEIYNYVELRRELEQMGFRFRTGSDTEVLLCAYLAWNEKMLPRLNGMWAFALFDTERRKLLVSRDRIGERSFFYTKTPDAFFFASEIKALFAVQDIWNKRKAEDSKIFTYLYTGIRDTSEKTFFENISQLPPASFAWISAEGDMDIRKYWTLPSKRMPVKSTDMDDAAGELAALLNNSIKLRLRSDVPLASELSGGMDSSSIVSLAAQQIKDEYPGRKLQVFTVTYDNSALDESDYARQTAEMAGAELHTLRLDSSLYWPNVTEMAAIQEQPFESPNLTGSRTIWQTLKEQNIRVVLNGGGGDELLAGYLNHHLLPFLGELAVSGRLVEAVKEACSWKQTPYINAILLRRFLLYNLPRTMRKHYAARVLRFSTNPAVRKPTGEISNLLMAEINNRSSGVLSDILTKNMTVFPMPMYMVQADKLSMSIPMEVRFPFLDHRIIDFAFRLPVDLLIRAGWSKAILRIAMKDRIPDAVLKRKEKMGFPVPLEQWIKEGLPCILAQFRNHPRSSERFINAESFLEIAHTLPPELVWRIHQVETWMQTYDLD